MGDQEKHDVAIVGGGVSGLYAGWRILADARTRGKPVPRVTIYELGDRIGGRLQTWLPFGPDGGIRAELGGMRFLDNQQLLCTLLAELGFARQDFLPLHGHGPNLRLLLRGRGTALTTTTPTKRYKVSSSARDKQAADVLAEVITEVLGTEENRLVLKALIGKDCPADRREWDAVKAELTWHGRPLWDVGFWNLLSDVRNPETYQYLCDAFGYYSLAGNWNAAEAMEALHLDFTPGLHYLTLAEGMQALPDTIAEHLTRLGGSVEPGTRLAGFDVGADGRPSLKLVTGPSTRTTVADQLILALPRRSLELLAPTAAFDLPGDDGLRRLVQAVTPNPAFKLFLWYADRWWERRGITQGRSVSDLPIRQTYYFAPDGPVRHSAGLLMASYDDARAVDSWHGLCPTERELATGRDELHTAMRNFVQRHQLGGAAHDVPRPPPHLSLATEGMRRHATSQLARLHGVPEDHIPDADVGAFADWTPDPYGGGWNFWNVGVDVRTSMARIKQPLGPGTRVHVVGEAYSGLQGWIEGALTATEVTLQRHFGVRQPDWFPTGYYLGW
ncbi:flavin monoamine oxidase family protein [Kibdelosporangium phytohabitans]|nr:FAD-dependent oxidoreductase [Kibdelosporangium phytohabitans]MBE1468940.1 monoamine oxidase [Kibdelosporangium phytohabitans]